MTKIRIMVDDGGKRVYNDAMQHVNIRRKELAMLRWIGRTWWI